MERILGITVAEKDSKKARRVFAKNNLPIMDETQGEGGLHQFNVSLTISLEDVAVLLREYDVEIVSTEIYK